MGRMLLSVIMLASSSLLVAQEGMRPLQELRGFYASHCVKCHGRDGSAISQEGRKLRGFDFTNREKLARKTDAQLVKTILKGKFFGRAMPSFKGELNEGEALLLVQEILRKAENGKPIEP